MHAHKNCIGVFTWLTGTHKHTTKRGARGCEDYRGLSMCVYMYLINETICIFSSTYCKVIALVLLSIYVNEIVFVADVYVIFID